MSRKLPQIHGRFYLTVQVVLFLCFVLSSTNGGRLQRGVNDASVEDLAGTAADALKAVGGEDVVKAVDDANGQPAKPEEVDTRIVNNPPVAPQDPAESRTGENVPSSVTAPPGAVATGAVAASSTPAAISPAPVAVPTPVATPGPAALTVDNSSSSVKPLRPQQISITPVQGLLGEYRVYFMFTWSAG
jgi:hypothetical protein